MRRVQVIFLKLGIEGAWLIRHEVIGDERGDLKRTFDEKEFQKHGIEQQVNHGLISRNSLKYTLRGFHYQLSPYLEAKTISCNQGSIYDVIVDLRKGSETFCKWISVELDSDSNESLHIPKGCANAWLTTTEQTIIHYYMSSVFSPNHSHGFRFDDDAFSVEWPHYPKVISDKDLSWKKFDRKVDGIEF